MTDDLSDLTPEQRTKIERLRKEDPVLAMFSLITIRNINKRRPPLTMRNMQRERLNREVPPDESDDRHP